MTDKPVIFISYSHKDEPEKPGKGERWLTYVQSHLAPAVRSGIFDLWVDEHIPGGGDWESDIKAKLAVCDVFILLVSNNSLSSGYIVETEFRTIEERQKSEEVHIFPVVLSPFSKKSVPWLTKFNLKPKNGDPLSGFTPEQRAMKMVEITDELVDIVDKIALRKKVGQVAEFKLERLIVPSTILVDSRTGLEALKGIDLSVRGPAVDVTQLPETAYEQLRGREAELKRLDDAWADPTTNILSLVAEGGAGKSALVNEWLKRLQADNYRGAEMVLGWSFYSQGSKERATSADQFFSWALGKLGIKLETTSASSKGEAIAEALVQRRVLLVLDGVEPLQHGPGPQAGYLKDLGLRALLRRFATISPGETQGLIVLSSRLAVKDIARWREAAAPVVDLGRLSDQAGAALLRDNGVWGTDKELADASRDFGGHPLALALLASFLKEKHFGDDRRRNRVRPYDEVRALLADPENPRHDHARRVMESYETEWLSDQPVLLAVMHLVGLFDRPASADCLQALRAPPAIEGLTEPIVKLDDIQWQQAISRLRSVGLLAPADPLAPGALDAHPLIREWFGERLRQRKEIAWRSAHRRLYRHLRDSAPHVEEPSLADLAPLYQAIAHGCQAGDHVAALYEVYVRRICRGNELYATKKLGATSSDLSAISWFFVRPYEEVIGSLDEPARATVLSHARYCLQSQGRISESIPLQHAALKLVESSSVIGNRRIGLPVIASALSDLQLLAGDIEAAHATAMLAVEYADQSNDYFQQQGRRAILASALLAAGRDGEAVKVLEEAQRFQVLDNPAVPILCSVSGYHYCDLKLMQRDWRAAYEHAATTIEIAKENNWLLDIGLDTLTLNRAWLGERISDQRSQSASPLPSPEGGFDAAVERLRAAGTSHHIPRGLLARAAFRRSLGDWDGAARDLDEVEELAEPGPMRLYLCDNALERARCNLAQAVAFAPLVEMLADGAAPRPRVPDAETIAELKEEADKQLEAAAGYIGACGYRRRDDELAELQAVLRGETVFASLPPRV